MDDHTMNMFWASILNILSRWGLRCRNIAFLHARPKRVVTRMVVCRRTTGEARARRTARRASGLGGVHALWFSNRGRIVDSASHKRRMREGEKKGGRRRRDSSSLAFPSPFLGLARSPGGGRISERCSDRDREREATCVRTSPCLPCATKWAYSSAASSPLLSSQSLHEMPIRYCYTRRGEEKDGGGDIRHLFFTISRRAA